MGYSSVNIHDIIDLYGVETVEKLARTFSCPLNKEIEDFMREKAIPFAQRKIAVTYFIMDEEQRLAGFFSLAVKICRVSYDSIGRSGREKLLRYGTVEEDDHYIQATSYLIAQLGKNFSLPESNRISGDELMAYAWGALQDVQRRIGGGVVILECEDKPGLLDYYQDRNKFKIYGKRFSENSNVEYLQLLRFF